MEIAERNLYPALQGRTGNGFVRYGIRRCCRAASGVLGQAIPALFEDNRLLKAFLPEPALDFGRKRD